MTPYGDNVERIAGALAGMSPDQKQDALIRVLYALVSDIWRRAAEIEQEQARCHSN